MSSHDDTPQDADAAELLPIFDPELPAEVRERLARQPESLLSAKEKLYRTDLTHRPWVKAIRAVFFLAVTVVFAMGIAWLIATFPTVMSTIIHILMLIGVVAGFRKRGFWGGFAAMILAGGLSAFGEWLGLDAAANLAAIIITLLGILGVIGIILEDDSPRIYHDHYFVPADFAGPARTLLLRVQHTRRLVGEAAEVLGDAFDGQQAVMIVQDQEWRLAQLLYQQQKLSAELAEREENAVSAAVRESLQPQREAIRAVHAALERRVNALVDYGDKVRLAMERHREWQQIEEVRSRDGAYGELLAEATTAQLGIDHLSSTADLEAIREARDASIRDALAAGQWLSQAADVLSSPEED